MKLWRYVMTVDTGFAPNFAPPRTTLATCMPDIRKKAQPGEVVLAFNGKTLHRDEPNSVRWAGVISQVMPLADYWNNPDFQAKRPAQHGGSRADRSPDNIYCPTPEGGLRQVANKWHGPADADRDIGGLNALAFERSWYFGSTVALLPEEFGLWITGGRRRARPSEIDGPTWRKLEKWLDDTPEKFDVVTLSAESQARCSSGPEVRPPPSGCGETAMSRRS